MTFSPDRLRGHRHGQRRTAKQVADLANLCADAVAQFEAGYVVPDLLTVQTLAAALEVDENELHVQRPNPAADYCHAVLRYARQLTPDEIETAATTIRKIRRKGKTP